ncbi:MAG: right-handed parallel beta-helix repeat-containing protein, partial [Clostridia bacterium]|nr:right-handed parallel beta-helix repeat-containing protein [Clostridia bacterium]
DYNVSVTLPENYDVNGWYDIFAKRLAAGFVATSANPVKAGTAFEMVRDAIYLAEEQAYTFNNTTDKNEISEGESLTATAELLNQIGLKGGLNQEFDWVVVNSTRTEEVDGFAITANGNQANVEAQTGVVPGTYYLIAISKADPTMMKGVQFTVKEKEAESVKIYVAPNGSDSASGTKDAPLATLKGARDKIRTMRSSGINVATDVIFAGGTYYFDSTVDFIAEDSGTEAAKVTYKAADGEKVVFTGAVSLDLASAHKVTDESILSRLKDEVKDKVVVIDLSGKISMSGESINATIQKLCGEYEYPELYLDGNEQMIAQWPNGNAEYATWGYVDQDTISYTDKEPSGWSNAKDWWIGGYLSYDYNYMRLPVTSVDTANKQISFEIDAANGLNADNTKTEKSYRWKAFNLLEEIDTPMEWYIDKDNMKLYYYPSKSSGNLEISSLKTSMINLTEADYIGFEGIQFENTRGNAVTATNIESVTVKGCTFKNIGTDAFAVYGTALAESDKNYWQRQYVDAAYNCEISDSVFNNIGGHAVLMDGGNVDTLTKGNNVIKNNIFYKGAQKIKNYETILLKGCGNEIINNNISRSAFQAIRHYGNDHKIMYNEIYNVIQETDDCGAIYCGRNTIQRGTEIAYNYLHDLKSTDELPFGHQVAVYLDDGQTGINVHHNIIKNVNKNVYTNGVDNTFNYNTSIDIAKTNLDIKDGGAASNADPETTAFSGYIENPELYYSVYPNLKTIVEASDRTDSSLALFNTLKGNLCVGGPGGNGIGDNTMYSKKPTVILGTTISAGTKNPNVSNNNDNGDASVFVDAANQDYRVKGTATLETSVLNESFNIDLIGVQTANAITASEISLAAPYDKENVNSEKVHFSWNDSFGATSYTVTVAADADFANIIAEETSNYNFADITIPANGASYYWKVTAHNTSREFNTDWESAVQTFTNGEKITATATLGSNNQIALSITNNYYTQGKSANVYIAEYDNDGKLLAAQILSTSLPYQTAETFEDRTVTIKNADAADVKLFVWDTSYSPLTETVKIK